MSIAAYKRTISDTESPRQIERRVLSQVTADLEKYQQEFDAAERSADKLELLAGGLRDVLWQNERIWMAFKSDLAEQGNALGPDLRAALLSLAMWVERHTRDVMSGSRKVRPLIEVNRTIISGLDGRTLNVME